MDRIYLTRIAYDGSVKLPQKVLAKVKWQAGECIEIKANEKGELEIRKCKEPDRLSWLFPTIVQ